MSFYDWNDDGKNDLQDDFIEYNMYNNSNGNLGDFSGNHKPSGNSTLWTIIVIIVMLMVIGWIIDLTETKCAYPGCDNTPAFESSL